MCDYQEERKCIGPIGRLFGHNIIDGQGKTDTYCARCGWILSQPIQGAEDIIKFYQGIVDELQKEVLNQMRQNYKSSQLEAHPHQETPHQNRQRAMYNRKAT